MRLPGKGIGWKEFFKTLKDEYKQDKVNEVAGALTFFGILALFPFILFAISLAGLLIDPVQAEGLVQQMSKVAPQAATQIMAERIHSVAQSRNVGLLSLGAVMAIWAASSGLAAVTRALNTAYDVTESRPFWKVRGIAIVMTLVSALLVVAASLAMILVPALADRLPEPLGWGVRIARIPVAGLLMMLLWALLYWALPDAEQRFKFISPGAVIGVVLWLVASWAFSVYVSNFGKYEATYGSVGGVIILLVWMWISAQVLLLGAEINSVIEHKSEEGKRPGAKSLADTGRA